MVVVEAHKVYMCGRSVSTRESMEARFVAGGVIDGVDVGVEVMGGSDGTSARRRCSGKALQETSEMLTAFVGCETDARRGFLRALHGRGAGVRHGKARAHWCPWCSFFVRYRKKDA